MRESFDAIIIGGGVMGCTTALTLAEGGLKVAIVEQNGLGSGATGVNAGTLSLQIKRTSLLQYAMRGSELWSQMSERLGFDIHFMRTGGLNLAFNAEEAEKLHTVMSERKALGLPLEFLGGNAAREREPALCDGIELASFSPLDGFASANLVGRGFALALRRAGVEIVDFSPVQTLAATGQDYEVTVPGRVLAGKRLVVASGAWANDVLGHLGIKAPLVRRINQMAVTERTGKLLNGVVGHISGLMSLKQAANGTILIGGGWQGEEAVGQVGRAIPDNLRNNIRFAQLALPAAKNLRLVRTWYGFECFVPDVMPMVGGLPGFPDAYMIGSVRGGFTIGPCMGQLLGQHILGQEPDLPISAFDPARYLAPKSDIQVA